MNSATTTPVANDNIDLDSEVVLPVGHTWECGGVRVHRYNSALVVTDLANAGKRGRKCCELSLFDLDLPMTPRESIVAEVMMLIRRGSTWERLVQAGTEAAQIGVGFVQRDLRGVDVAPGSVGEVRLGTARLYVEASPTSFVVRDRADAVNEPTAAPPVGGAKVAAARFYAWIQANSASVQAMTFQGVLAAMTEAGIGFHSFLAVD